MSTVILGVGVYLVLLFSVRVTQKRSLSDMTPFELLLLMMMGGAAVPVILGEDRSLAKAITFIATLLGTHLALAMLKMRSKLFSKVVDGTPVIIVEDGKVHRHRMNKMFITDEDVLASAREKGVLRFDNIRYAIVERNGSIMVIPHQS